MTDAFEKSWNECSAAGKLEILYIDRDGTHWYGASAHTRMLQVAPENGTYFLGGPL